MLAAHQAGVLARLNQGALGRHRGFPVDTGDNAVLLVFKLSHERVAFGQDDGDNGQVVLAGELEVALVATGNRHDGTRAVIGDDVVGHPDGHLLAVDGVHRVTAGEHAVLLVVALGALDGADLLGCLDQLLNGSLVLGAFHEGVQALVLGSQHKEGAAEQGVGTRGENGDDVVIGGVLGGVALGVAQDEVDLGALGAADPVGLLLLNAIGPALKLVKVVQKLLRVIGDLEVPLGKVALLHLGVATPAAALGHLLVGQDGGALGAPVNGAVAALDQALLPKLEEDPLAPAIVLGVAGDDRAVPIVREAHALEAGLLGFDVGIGPLGGMAVALDGSVLGGQAERVPAHGMKHVEAAHLVVAGGHVADRIVAHMAHMDVAGRIREHLQDVLLGLVGVFLDMVDVGVFPCLLQTRFNLVRIVFLHTLPSLFASIAGYKRTLSNGRKRKWKRQAAPSQPAR